MSRKLSWKHSETGVSTLALLPSRYCCCLRAQVCWCHSCWLRAPFVERISEALSCRMTRFKEAELYSKMRLLCGLPVWYAASS